MKQIEGVGAIIFDWGRTLYDKDNEQLFPEAHEVLAYCAKRYPLAVVSIATDDDIEGRFELLDTCNLRKYFTFALFHASDKNSLFRNAFGNFGIPPQEVLVVDDRMYRLGWVIQHDCKTIWIKKGKFAHELPNETTGEPTVTVSSLSDILNFV